MKLYVMRHGRTNYNELGLCNNDPSQDVHLTETGRQQAQQAATYLKDKSISRIMVSELPRTQQTAEIVNQYHAAPVTVHAELNDITSGFDSRPVADYYQAIASDPLHTQPPGGESLLQHKQRIFDFLDWLCRQPEPSVLIVAHEETLRAISVYIDKLADPELLNMHFDNAQVLEFELP